MSWQSRLTNVFRATKVDADLDEELRFHHSARVDELIAQGLSREDAAAEAAAAWQPAAAARAEP